MPDIDALLTEAAAKLESVRAYVAKYEVDHSVHFHDEESTIACPATSWTERWARDIAGILGGTAALRSVQVPETSTLTDDEVVVEGSIFRRADLPMVLGNFMRLSDERGREVKQLLTMLTELRPVRDEDSRTLSTHADPSVQVPDEANWSELFPGTQEALDALTIRGGKIDD